MITEGTSSEAISSAYYVISIASVAVVAIAWLIRLEMKASSAKDEVKELKQKHEAHESKVVEKLSVIEVCLAKIEGRLSVETEK